MEKLSRAEAEIWSPERALEGERREKFVRDLNDFIAGLEAALADPDLPEDDRRELAEELAGFKDSQEAIEAGGAIRFGGQ